MVKKIKKHVPRIRRKRHQRPTLKEILKFYCFSNLKWVLCVAIVLACIVYIFDYGRTFNGSKQIIFFIVLCIAITIRIIAMELVIILIKTAYYALTSKKFPDDSYRSTQQKDLSNLERIQYHLRYLHDKLIMKNESKFAPIVYERRTVYYNRLIYELFLISIPTILLAALLINAKNNEAYYSKVVMSSLISYESLRNFSARTKFSAITGDIYNYFNHTALPALHGTINHDGKNYKGSTVRDGVGLLVGKIRLRQQRHKPIKGCPIPLESNENVTYKYRCGKSYAKLEWDNQDYAPYWNELRPDSLNDSYNPQMSILREPFLFRSAEETQAVPISTMHHTYDASGYTVGLGRTLPNSQSILGYLRNATWIDNRTMVVFLEYNIYNVNSNFMLVNTVVIQNFLAGELETFFQTKIIRFNMLARKLEWGILTWLLACFCAIIWYIFYLFKRLLVSSFVRFTSNIWNVFDIIILSLLFSMAILFFIRDAKVTTTLYDYEVKVGFVYYPFHKLAEYEATLFLLAGIYIFLAIIRLWRSLQFSLMFRIFTMTIEKAKWALFNTAINIIIFSIAFTLVMGLLTGSDVQLFHGIMRGVPAILSSTYVIRGQNRLQDAFYSALLGVTTIYFVNMFIVSLLYYFEQAKTEISYEKEFVKYSFWRFITIELKESFRTCISGIWASSFFSNKIERTRLSRLRGGGKKNSKMTKLNRCPQKVEFIDNQFKNPTLEKFNISEQILDTQFLYLKTYIDDEMIDCHLGADNFLELFHETLHHAIVRDDVVELQEYYVPELDDKHNTC